MSLGRFPRLFVAVGLALAVSGTGLAQASEVSGSQSQQSQAEASATEEDHAGHGHFGASGQSLAGDYWDSQPTPETRASTVDPWPTAATMVARLQAHGLNPILTAGYDDPVYERNAHLNGTGTTPRAVMMHDTGTGVPAERLRNTHSLNWILSGVKNSSGQTVRACHFYVARDGSVYFIYARRTWHAGAGDPMFGIPANKMNGYSYGIEIESQGDSVQDLTPEQITAASKVAAAALEASQLPIDRQIDHKLYAGRVQGKVDTAYDLSMWRSLTAAEMGVSYIAPLVSSNPKHISMAMMKLGASGTYVKRYQKALRKYASNRGLKLSRYNPSGATGYYGNETRALTRAVHSKLKKSSASWRNYLVGKSVNYPSRKLIKKVGMLPIS
jgi:hypothetical protein